MESEASYARQKPVETEVVVNTDTSELLRGSQSKPVDSSDMDELKAVANRNPTEGV